MKKILIVEDDNAISMLLEYDLKSKGYLVELVSDGKEALNKILLDYYDLVIIDWMLPSLSGLDVIKQVRHANKSIKFFMISAKDAEYEIIQSLEAGANDYLTKPFSSRELMLRIKNLLSYDLKHVNDYRILTYQDIILDESKRQVVKKDQVIQLTKTEYEIFYLLLNNINDIVTRKQILKYVWDYDNLDESRIIDIHIFSLRNKLQLKTTMLVNKRSIGYLLLE